MPKKLEDLMAEEERKAWDSLCRYKFEMFGYHASRWVMLNKLLKVPLPNPWSKVVKAARESTGFQRPATPTVHREEPVDRDTPVNEPAGQ